MKQYLFFDFDGTVIDNSEGIYNCIRYALKKMDLPIPSEAVLRSFVGPSLHDSFLRHCENDPARADVFVDFYRERYAPVGKLEVRLYPDMKEILQKLAAMGYTLAVCSAKPMDYIVDIAKYLGIYELFSFYSCPGFSVTSSNKEDLINACLARFGNDKEKSLMIGDTKFDILAAKITGVQALGALYGFSAPGELEISGADYLAEDTEALYEILCDLRRGTL